MRTCRIPFRHLYLKPGGNGNVTLCNWNWEVVGNLRENTLEEIWNGERAREVREAFLKGELCGCDEPSCALCLQNSPELELSDEEIREWSVKSPPLPERLCVAHDIRCNHACPSCRHEIYHPTADYIDNMKQIVANIEPYLPKMHLKFLDINGGGDIFACRELLDMLSRYQPTEPDFQLILETNGVLFKDNWKKIEHLGKHMMVAVTPNSLHRETYRYLAGVDNYSRFLESMEFISDLRRQKKIKQLRMTMVVQDSNFRELPEFIDKCLNHYGADIVVLRPIFKWFGITEDELLYKNVLNPCHPYHSEYLEILKDPIFKDERIYDWGYRTKQEPVEFPTLEEKREYLGNVLFGQKVCSCISDIRDELKEYTDSGNRIIIFGAGKAGKEAFNCLSTGKEILPVRGFMVSNKCEEGGYCMGCPIGDGDDYLDTKDTDVVLIAITQGKRTGAEEYLRKKGYVNVIAIDARSEKVLS